MKTTLDRALRLPLIGIVLQLFLPFFLLEPSFGAVVVEPVCHRRHFSPDVVCHLNEIEVKNIVIDPSMCNILFVKVPNE